MRRTGLVAAVAVLLGGSALVAPPSISAQEPTATATIAGSEHLAAIHAGTCRQLAEEPAYVLGVVGPQRGEDGEVADAADIRGQLVAPPLLMGDGTVEIALDALLDGGQPFALVVHQTADAVSDPVACGEIGGVVDNGQLALALRPLGRSGFAGVAVLGATETGGTAGTVLLFSDVDAYAPGARAGRGGGGGRGEGARQGGGQGGRQGGGGRAGGQTDGVVTGGVATDDAATGGVATDGGGDGDRTPRPRRTRVPGQVAPTEVPTTDGEAPGIMEGEPIGTVAATVEPTVADPIATVPADAGATATAPVDGGVVATATVEAGPTEVVPTDVAPTTGPEDALPTTIPEETPPAGEPATGEPAADEAPPVDPVEEEPPAETEGEAAPPVEGETEPPAEEQPAETPAA